MPPLDEVLAWWCSKGDSLAYQAQARISGSRLGAPLVMHADDKVSASHCKLAAGQLTHTKQVCVGLNKRVHAMSMHNRGLAAHQYVPVARYVLQL